MVYLSLSYSIFYYDKVYNNVMLIDSLYHCLEHYEILCALIILYKKPHHLTEGFISDTHLTL